MGSYGEFVSHVLGLLQTIGILDPLRYFLLFILALAGMGAFIKFLAGRYGG